MATNDLLRRMARLGAMRRIESLRNETNEILRQFPELGRTTASARTQAPVIATSSRRGSRKRRRKMTPAQRKAVGERMKKYWADRRAGAGKTARKK